MASHPPKNHSGPGLATLPFGGLGLDLAEVRRKTDRLVLSPLPRREEAAHPVLFAPPPRPSGYRLLVRLCRETLGS